MTIFNPNGIDEPTMTQLGRGALVYGFQYPTCQTNGAHRYSAPHALGKDRKRWMVKCRICSQSIVTWFDEELGKIVEKVSKTSTQDIVDK